MKGDIKVTGDVKVTLDGKVVHEGKNLVVNVGLELIAKLLAGTGTAPSHMACGSSGTASAASDTALGTELHRPALTSHTQLLNSFSVHAVFTGLNSGTESIREFGIFNGSSGGTMLARFTTTLITWPALATLLVDWTINIGVEE